MSALGETTIDKCGNVLELEVRSPGMLTGLSVLVTPAQFALLADQAERLEPMIAWRAAVAREAANHAAKRGAR